MKTRGQRKKKKEKMIKLERGHKRRLARVNNKKQLKTRNEKKEKGQERKQPNN